MRSWSGNFHNRQCKLSKGAGENNIKTENMYVKTKYQNNDSIEIGRH